MAGWRIPMQKLVPNVNLWTTGIEETVKQENQTREGEPQQVKASGYDDKMRDTSYANWTQNS